MKAKAFKYFVEEILAASAASPVWRFGEYWNGMTEKQRLEVAQILDHNPDVRKLVRDGVTVYQLPTGREWTA